MWKQPWGYIEGWIICIGIVTTGIILQFTSGKMEPESFRFPVNLIFGALFLIFLLLLHLFSGKNKLFRWFSGLTAGVTSITALLLLIIIMGFTRQLHPSVDVSRESGFVRMGFMQMTVSWPFILLSYYFLAILGLVILRRLSRFSWKDTGFILNHAGLFIAFLAALLGSSDMQRLRMSVPLHETEWRATDERNEMVELPLAIELKSFIIDEYPPKVMVLNHTTGVTLPEKKPENVLIETVPSVTRLLDWELEIVDYLPSAAVMANRDTVNCIEYHAEGATSALYVKARHLKDGARNEGWVSCGNYQFPYASLRLDETVSLIMPDLEPRRFTSDVTVYTQKGDTKEALIEVNKPLSMAGWKIYQLSYDTVMGKWSRYSVFELVKDPWLPVVYSGIMMLLAGSVFLFISTPQKQ